MLLCENSVLCSFLLSQREHSPPAATHTHTTAAADVQEPKKMSLSGVVVTKGAGPGEGQPAEED